MNDRTKQIFLNGIKDTKGLERLTTQLEEMTKELYHNQQGTITQKLKGKMLPSIEAIFAWLEQNGLEPGGDSEQKKFLDEIIKYLHKVPQVKVTLAFEPDEMFIAKINEQVSILIGQKILLDIQIDNRIVGGSVLEYKGKHKDYSIAPKVASFLRETISKHFPEPEKEDKK